MLNFVDAEAGALLGAMASFGGVTVAFGAMLTLEPLRETCFAGGWVTP